MSVAMSDTPMPTRSIVSRWPRSGRISLPIAGPAETAPEIMRAGATPHTMERYADRIQVVSFIGSLPRGDAPDGADRVARR